MTHPENLEELFYQIYSSLDETSILHINQLQPSQLNNVVVGLEKENFGLMCMDDTDKIIYRLFYATNEEELQGDIIELEINNPNRDKLVFFFAEFLAHNYNCLDTINVYNTYQRQTRYMLEKIGFLTISPLEFKKYNDPNPLLLAKGVRGIINIPIIDKVEFYKSFFGHKNINELVNRGNDFIYIMLNKRTDLLKIGKSKKPSFREKTLQGQEPEVSLITFGEAPKEIEKKLHKEYSHKRQRGEWFNLTFRELNSIKELMEPYN